MPKKAIYSISMMLFLTFIAFWGVYQMQPPGIVPNHAPEDQFSAERAKKHLIQITVIKSKKKVRPCAMSPQIKNKRTIYLKPKRDKTATWSLRILLSYAATMN